MRQKIKLQSEGEEIVGDFYLPCETAPIVTCCHGVEYGEEWDVVQRLPDAGLGVLIFPFRSRALDKRLSDLDSALDWVESHTARIGLFGHSLGGVTSLLKAAQDTRIKALVIWGTPAYFRPIEETARSSEGGDSYQDARRRGVIEIAERITCPVLIVHGSSDETVPVEHAQILHDGFVASGQSPHVELRIVQAGHADNVDEVFDHAIDMFKAYL